MFIVIVPRLLSLSTIYSLATLDTWKFYLCLTAGVIGLHGLLFSGLSGGPICTMTNQYTYLPYTFLGFFTSIIAPCVVGDPETYFLVGQSIISALVHTLALATVWITSTYQPDWSMSPSNYTRNDTSTMECIATSNDLAKGNLNATTLSSTLSTEFNIEAEIPTLNLYFLILIPFLLFSPVISYIMMRLYRREQQKPKREQQKFELRMLFK